MRAHYSDVIDEDETQSTFTGREQWQGVWVLPFLLAGLLDRRVSSTNAGGASVAPPGPHDGEEEAQRLLLSLFEEHSEEIQDGEQTQDGEQMRDGEQQDPEASPPVAGPRKSDARSPSKRAKCTV